MKEARERGNKIGKGLVEFMIALSKIDNEMEKASKNPNPFVPFTNPGKPVKPLNISKFK